MDTKENREAELSVCICAEERPLPYIMFKDNPVELFGLM